MDFALTKQQELIQKSAREFAEREISPLDAQIDKEGKVPLELFEKAAKIGLLGIPVEREYGGSGGTYLDLSLAVEQIARVNGAVAFFISVNYLTVVAINLFGSEEQKQKFLPDLAQGKCVGAFSFTEQATGSDPGDIQARAKLDGDYYVCNGNKRFCTNAEYDGTIVIFLRTGDGPYDVSAFAAEKNTEGYTAPPPWPLMGLNGMRVTDIELKDYRIPKANLLGKEGDGYKALLGTIAIGKLNVSNALLGIAQDALEQAIKYAQEKTMRDRPIGDFQMIQFLIAEMASKVEAGRWMLRQAMSLIDQGKATLQSAAMAKLFVAEMADDVCQKAVQIHGGYGYTKEFKVERLYRDAKFGGVVEGSNEVQRVIIARDILRKK